jgi:hypothetical protein
MIDAAQVSSPPTTTPDHFSLAIGFVAAAFVAALFWYLPLDQRVDAGATGISFAGPIVLVALGVIVLLFTVLHAVRHSTVQGPAA